MQKHTNTHKYIQIHTNTYKDTQKHANTTNTYKYIHIRINTRKYTPSVHYAILTFLTLLTYGIYTICSFAHKATKINANATTKKIHTQTHSNTLKYLNTCKCHHKQKTH